MGVLFLAGCKGQCRIDSDCPGKPCYDVSCQERECVQTSVPNCCGNARCEKGEDACSCQVDCGRCEGKEGKYLEKLCLDNQCQVGLDRAKIQIQSLTHSKDLTGFKINVLASIDQPFDVDMSTMYFEAEMTDRKENVEMPKLSKVQVLAKSNRQEVILGEKDFNRPFWNIGSKISDKINLHYPFEKKENEVEAFIRVFYEYTEKIGGERKIRRTQYDKTLGSKMIFVNPDRSYSCSAAKHCNDNNDCTLDSCVEDSLLCNHELIPNCCGNYQCEENENKANCPMDCGPCEGTLGRYLEYRQDSDGSCMLGFKTGVLQPVVLSKTKALTDFTLTMKSNFKQPLDVGKENFTVEIILDDYDPAKIQMPITLTRIQLLDSKTVAGEEEKDLRLLALGRKVEASLAISLPMTDVEAEKDMTLKVYYSYNEIKGTNRVELRTGIIEDPLGQKIVFVRTS